jgi:prepilin-type N-terminal cleavage/methylation domain-containing protein
MRTRFPPEDGFTLIEQLMVVAIVTVLVGTALPVTSGALDSLRTLAATRYLAARMVGARMEAIKRSTQLALRFEAGDPDYTFVRVLDGNGNGVRTADVRRGIDRLLDRPERIGDNFKDVRLALMDGVPDADDAMGTGTDGVRIGAARILTMSPNGTATAGTVYVRGRRAQYAIRILGATGRVRVLQYMRGERKWINR